MKKIVAIVVVCMIFSLFCSCEQEIAESSVPKQETSSPLQSESSIISSGTEGNVGEQIPSADTSSQEESDHKISSTVSLEVSYADSSSRKPVRPPVNSGVSSAFSSQAQTSKPTSSLKPGASSTPATSLSSSSSTQQNVAGGKIIPIKEEEYYGYLELQKNGTAAEKKAYQLLKKEIGNYQREVKFDFDISREEVERAYHYYRDDYPQHFWHGNALLFKDVDGKIISLTLRDMLCGGNAEKVKALDGEMKQAAEKILKNVNASMTPFEREEYIHNYLIDNCMYEEAEYSHTAYGALVNGKAVCEGYSYAFEYLMRLAGVQCISVKGILHQQGEEPESHEWNMVQLDGQYYHVDLTSNDPLTFMQNGDVKDVLKFTYFNIDDKTIAKDHIIKENTLKVPTATAKKYNYFEYYKLSFDKLSVENFAKAYAHAAEKNYARACLKIRNINSSEFAEFITKNYYNIVLECNKILGNKKIKIVNSLSYVIDEKFDIVNIELNYA